MKQPFNPDRSKNYELNNQKKLFLQEKLNKVFWELLLR